MRRFNSRSPTKTNNADARALLAEKPVFHHQQGVSAANGSGKVFHAG
jgi:hypothetical protein